MARHGKAYKVRIDARLLPPESAAVNAVSARGGREGGDAGALALAGASGERGGGVQRRTAAARFQAVIATAAMDEAARSARIKVGSLDVQVYGLGSTSRSLRRRRGLDL